MTFISFKLDEHAVNVIFLRLSLFFPHRSSELWCNQTVDLQDCLQTPLCAKEMQPWVHVDSWRSSLLSAVMTLGNQWKRLFQHEYRLNTVWLITVSLPYSSSGGCLEHDRSLSWQRAQHIGPQRWDQCVAAGDDPVFHLLPAQQAAAHHPSDQCGAVHWAAAQLYGGHLWQVRVSAEEHWTRWFIGNMVSVVPVALL